MGCGRFTVEGRVSDIMKWQEIPSGKILVEISSVV